MATAWQTGTCCTERRGRFALHAVASGAHRRRPARKATHWRLRAAISASRRSRKHRALRPPTETALSRGSLVFPLSPSQSSQDLPSFVVHKVERTHSGLLIRSCVKSGLNEVGSLNEVGAGGKSQAVFFWRLQPCCAGRQACTSSLDLQGVPIIAGMVRRAEGDGCTSRFTSQGSQTTCKSSPGPEGRGSCHTMRERRQSSYRLRCTLPFQTQRAPSGQLQASTALRTLQRSTAAADAQLRSRHRQAAHRT